MQRESGIYSGKQIRIVLSHLRSLFKRIVFYEASGKVEKINISLRKT
jgi:hypothetical protein